MSQREGEAAIREAYSDEASEARAGAPAASEKAMAEYLRSHPDFFERHGDLLLKLRVPHATNASTISLVERQVSMLRDRSDQLDRRLKDLVAVAKLNDALVENLHRLSMNLIRAPDMATRLERIETSLREDFAAERAVLVLFSDLSGPERERPGFVLHFDREDPALKPFATFLRAARTRCGALRTRQKELLFGRDAESVGSAAMIVIGTGRPAGFIVIGNKDDNYFSPTKSMDFLNRLGGLIAVALEVDQPGK